MSFSIPCFILEEIYHSTKLSLKIVLLLATFVFIVHGGRLLRYNGCTCGVGGTLENDFYQGMGK